MENNYDNESATRKKKLSVRKGEEMTEICSMTLFSTDNGGQRLTSVTGFFNKL